MSWWPFSSGGADAKLQAQPQSQIPQTPSPLAVATQPTPPQPETAPHDADFYAAHPHLAPPSLATTSTSSSSPHTVSAHQDDEPLSPHLPRTMSCRAAFDSAFYCSSLGGHFNDIYRYGQLRSCSEHWNDFWFCMRVKNSYSPRETKERMIQDRYREKEERVKSGPSSEDVWSARGEGEQVVGAFRMAAPKDGETR